MRTPDSVFLSQPCVLILGRYPKFLLLSLFHQIRKLRGDSCFSNVTNWPVLCLQNLAALWLVEAATRSVLSVNKHGQDSHGPQSTVTCHTTSSFLGTFNVPREEVGWLHPQGSSGTERQQTPSQAVCHTCLGPGPHSPVSQ